MKFAGNRLLRRVPILSFPLAIYSATGDSVADFVEEEEFVALVRNSAVCEFAKRQAPGRVLYVSSEMQEMHGRPPVYQSSHASRAIPSVDRIRSDQGNESWMMRFIGDDGQLRKDPSLRAGA